LFPHQYGDTGGDAFPFRTEFRQAFLTARSEAVIIATPAIDFLPPAAHTFFGFQVVKVGIDAPLSKSERIAGLEADLLDDLIPVHLATGQEAENQQLWHAVEETGVGFLHEATIPITVMLVNIKL
jgi:hypothetical protein